MSETDLFCLVADRNMEAAVSGLLTRPESLGIRKVSHRIVVHPERDPGCFHRGPDFLRGFRFQADHALIMLDFAWDGAPGQTGAEVEQLLDERLGQAGMGEWARAVVIDPELEAWVFSDSPHVKRILGWDADTDLGTALRSQGFLAGAQGKPSDPKSAMEWSLRRSRTPRSSSIYRNLAERVGTASCTDRAFVRFRELLRLWFPPART